MDCSKMTTEGWGKCLNEFCGFTASGLLEYFGDTVTRPTNKGRQFFQEGYIQKPVFHSSPFPTELTIDSPVYGFEARCLPSMKKGSYQVKVAVNKRTGMVVGATCGCPAGLDAKCHHIAALLYFMVAVTDLGIEKLPENKTCTDQLCKWIRPGEGAKSGLPLSELDFFKKGKIYEPLKVNRVQLSPYDPRASYHKTVLQDSVETLFTKLAVVNRTCAFVTHYNSDAVKNGNIVQNTPLQFDSAPSDNEGLPMVNSCNENMDLESNISISSTSFQKQVTMYIAENYKFLSVEDVKELEEKTLGQSDNPQWFTERKKRLTASKFGSICKLSVAPDNLLKSILYSRQYSSCATRHGQKFENTAIIAYTIMKEREETPVTVTTSGLLVMPTNPFLAGSPDGLVAENNNPNLGLLEVKCPYSKFGMSICDSVKSNSFYLQEGTNGIRLRRNHPYYYQIQGCLAITNRSWCDFFVWLGENENQKYCERIYFDKDLWERILLPSAFHFLRFAFIPELILEKVKRGQKLYVNDQYIPFRPTLSKDKKKTENKRKLTNI